MGYDFISFRTYFFTKHPGVYTYGDTQNLPSPLHLFQDSLDMLIFDSSISLDLGTGGSIQDVHEDGDGCFGLQAYFMYSDKHVGVPAGLFFRLQPLSES